MEVKTAGQTLKTCKFPKEGRLHHRSLVEGLYRFGKSFYEFPFRVTWRILNDQQLEKNFRNNIPEGIGKVQMMVTVPKKKRKKAIDRVLMRRRIREAYRLNRGGLMQSANEQEKFATLSLSLVYIHNQNLPYSMIEEKMKVLIDKLLEKVESLEQK